MGIQTSEAVRLTDDVQPTEQFDVERTPDTAAFGGLTVDEFKAAFRNHPGGVAVVTADAGDGPVGLTVTSVFSVSAEPPLFVFSISGQSSSAPTIARADTVVVHLLGAEQLGVAQLFATSGVDRFADRSSWDRLASGEPFLPGAPTWIRGRIVSRMAAGGSTVVAVHALQSDAQSDVERTDTAPLVYHNRTWHHIGEHSRLAQ